MFDFSSPLFWYRLVFLAELIVAEAFFTFKLRRRPYFALRIALSVVAIYGVTFLLPIVAYNAFYVSFMFLLMFGMTIVGLRVCFDAPLLNIVFCAVAAYSVQHIAYEVYTFLITAFGLQTAPGGPYEQTSRQLFDIWSFAVYIESYVVIYGLMYLLFGTRIKSGEDLRIGNVSLLIISGVILFVAVMLNLVVTYRMNEDTDFVLRLVVHGYNVICCVLAVFIQFFMLGRKKMQTEFDTLQRLHEQERRHYELFKDNVDYINVKCHDLKHQIRRIASEGKVSDAVESVGKPRRLEIDGPAGFHAPDISQNDRGKLVAFPAETLLGCTWNQETAYNMGRAQGVIGSALNINGWYGPGLNLHRNPFSGRYFEYYSEDPIVIGKLAAEVIRGAANTGLYCYMKHFAVSEEGINPENVYTWLTEQTMREIYLKPFEIAVKEGGANGVMTSFNCIGAVWAGACDPMNNDILRGEWGFRGSLITDWSLGRPYMNGMQGIRAGNDLMMDLDEPFDRSATTLTLLRTASKNALYTFANTYARAKDYQENGDADDRYSVELKMAVTEAPFLPIPVVMVVGIWVLAAAGIAVCAIFIIKKPEEKPEE